MNAPCRSWPAGPGTPSRRRRPACARPSPLELERSSSPVQESGQPSPPVSRRLRTPQNVMNPGAPASGLAGDHRSGYDLDQEGQRCSRRQRSPAGSGRPCRCRGAGGRAHGADLHRDAGAEGVSAATREHIFKAAQEIGDRPDTRARPPRSRHSRLLGVQFGLQHPLHANLVECLHAAAEPAGYQIALSAVAASRQRAARHRGAAARPLRGADPARPAGPAARLEDSAAQLPVICVARQLPPSAPGRAGGPDRRRRRSPSGRGPPRCPRPRDIAHIDGGRAPRRRRPAPRLPHCHAAPRPGDPASCPAA